jgi:hypothetical protein
MNENQTRSTQIQSIFILLGLCTFLYVLRIIHAEFVWEGGSDFPDVVMFGMRLHDTSPFVSLLQKNNTFFQIFTLTRGYSRAVIPYVTYYIVFELLGVTVTQKAFIYIHSLWGVISLLGIYAFCRQFLSQKRSYLAMFLIGLAPTLLNYNRNFFAPYSIEMTFYYAGLACLYRYIVSRKNIWRIAYALLTFWYLGAGNTIFIGLAFQMFFFLLCQQGQNLKERFLSLWRFFLHWSTVLFVILPAAGIIRLGFFFYKNGLRYGQIMHVIMNRGDAQHILKPSSFPLLPFLANSILILGFVALLLPYAVIWIMMHSKKHAYFSIYVYLLSYVIVVLSLVLAAGRDGFWYTIMIVPPAIMLAVVPQRKLYKYLLLIIMAISPFWTYYLNYNDTAPRGFYGYAAGFYGKVEENTGLKTLAYLVKKGTLPVSKNGPKWIGIFMDFEGAWFYLGQKVHDRVLQDIGTHEYRHYEKYLIVYRYNWDRMPNSFVKEYAIEKHLYHIGTILEHEKSLMEIYANYARPYEQYDVQQYDAEFDREFGNMGSYVKYWLGGP